MDQNTLLELVRRGLISAKQLAALMPTLDGAGADQAQAARDAAMLPRRNQLLRGKPERDAGYVAPELSPDHREQMEDVSNALLGGVGAAIPTLPMAALGPGAAMFPLTMAAAGGYAGYNHRRNNKNVAAERSDRTHTTPHQPFADAYKYDQPY